MDQDNPRVSVIMPAFNEERYISRSVRSILQQTFRDFELVIIDDGSTDKTWEAIRQFRDSRVRPVRCERQGLVRSLNKGLDLARGEYIARMDADDQSLPKRLEKQVSFLDTHPEVGVLGTGYYKYDMLRGEQFVRLHPAEDGQIRHAMGFYIPICHGSVMVRRTVFETVGHYDPDMIDAEDLELWLRAAKYFRFANLQEPLYVYWFDPEHSFFESSLGRWRRVTRKLRLSARAIEVLGLPRYYYLLVAATLLYNFTLPTRGKRIVRKLVSRSRDLVVTSGSRIKQPVTGREGPESPRADPTGRRS